MSENAYKIVTDHIIAQLEKGIIPWHQPWMSVRGGAYSRSTGKPYSLLNQLLINKPGEYATFKQIKEAGGHVKKGEKGYTVVFWKPFKVVEKDKDGEEKTKYVPLLKHYTVFHVEDQCEGIEPKHEIGKEKLNEGIEPIEAAEKVVTDYIGRSGVQFRNERGNNAYYRRSTDEIVMPLMEQFEDAVEYYSTAYHEMVHSTGHEKRLNRVFKTAAKSKTEYSKEELVAEIGSSMLLNEVGIETKESFENNTAYIQGWLSALRKDNGLIVQAAGKAEKAVKFILGIDDGIAEGGAE